MCLWEDQQIDTVEEERDTDRFNLASFTYEHKLHGDRCTVHIPVVYLAHKVYKNNENTK